MDIDDFLDFETTSGDDCVPDDDPIDEDVPTPGTKLTAFQRTRFKKLGFVPQKEIYCNKYLPYAEQLDDESQKMLTELKEGLAKAVALREMTPGVGMATSRLLVYVASINTHTCLIELNRLQQNSHSIVIIFDFRYLKLYGLKFSKEDHVKFIKLLLALIETPELEPAKLNKLCIVLSQLLR